MLGRVLVRSLAKSVANTHRSTRRAGGGRPPTGCRSSLGRSRFSFWLELARSAASGGECVLCPQAVGPGRCHTLHLSHQILIRGASLSGGGAKRVGIDALGTPARRHHQQQPAHEWKGHGRTALRTCESHFNCILMLQPVSDRVYPVCVCVPLYMVGSGRAERPWFCICLCCSRRRLASRTGFSNWVLRLM